MSRADMDKIRRIISDIFYIPFDEVTETSSPDTIENWDSIQQLNLVLALEQNFKMQFGPDEINQMKDAMAIYNIVTSKLLKKFND